MRSKVLLSTLCLLMVTGFLVSSVAATPAFPNLPSSAVTLTVKSGAGIYPILIELSNVPAGYDVTNATYDGFCDDLFTQIQPNVSYSVILTSSLGLPTPWDKINYILNNKQGTAQDVQGAIWLVMGHSASDILTNAGFTPSATAIALFNDADANGAGFIPGSNQIVAVLCDAGPDVQEVMIELTVPPTTTGATRTIGFWQTHTTFTEWVFDNKLSGSIQIDSSTSHAKNINTYGKLFGAFYCSIPKNTDHTSRPGIDQNRTILLQQLVGAILNHAASGVTVPIDPVTGNDLITAGNLAYSSNNGTEMLRVKGLLDTFNGSGEITAFPAGFPPQGSATPQVSKAIANKAFWNSPL